MPKIIKVGFFALLLALVIIQFLPVSHNNGKVMPDKDISQVVAVPSAVQVILKNSCYDCHSNHTKYPWYNKVQPVAWFLEGHIVKGKKELNFNQFGEFSKRRQRSKLKAVGNQIRDEEMPLKTYTFLHRDAKLSKGEKKLILDWIDKTVGKLK